MKLTNTIRDAFIRAAMDDVPQTDYQEKTIKVVLEDAVKQLPPKVRAIYQDKELGQFVRLSRGYYGAANVGVPCADKTFTPTPEAAAKIRELKNASDAQEASRDSLRIKLHACAYACSSRKALVNMLPEFEKYLPEDEAAANRTLPVVANVVSDFVAAGWPKGKGKAKK